MLNNNAFASALATRTAACLAAATRREFSEATSRLATLGMNTATPSQAREVRRALRRVESAFLARV
jgi:hypothetical protein